ncbi:unnamed protein product [Brachionus calyciflorus]|uniref:Uncharacterized protein n=1 Tax=Brachionus calyciflorus TaxID=104777 RepID=A0A813M6R1_9BILA|nr:unnamed protein product [Brachionus calyciflorus]
MDIIDPRIFLNLPEHASHAHSTWNCALFLAQISNLESILTDTFSKQINDGEPLSTSSSSANLLNDLKIINSFKMIKASSSNLDLNTESNSKTSNQIEEMYNGLNESIMNIYKVKKRNKASLYNLILPFNFNTDNRDLDNQQQNKLVSNLKSSTPWMCESLANDGYKRFVFYFSIWECFF